ncbi:hypothetical protein SDC9_153845 [bioreactor metagenome]|uniref:Uncharacterized protein n=1 Tax=bioreactor metagenome TaxID=1076179 RepID=A0A645EZH5_9ZZZZ
MGAHGFYFAVAAFVKPPDDGCEHRARHAGIRGEGIASRTKEYFTFRYEPDVALRPMRTDVRKHLYVFFE